MTKEIVQTENIDKEESKLHKFKSFLMTTLNGMTLGLFATLIIGTIFQQIGLLISKDNVFITVSDTLSLLMGAGIGLGIGISLKLKNLKLILSAVIGGIATSFQVLFVSNDGWNATFYKPLIVNPPGAETIKPGNPLTVYLVVTLAIFILSKLIKRSTPVDLILLPLLSVIVSGVLTYIVSGPSGLIIYYISRFVDVSTNAVPFLMTIIISVAMGMILTAPISSAAIAFMINLGMNPVAAAAAVVGTSTQMVGFAIQSRKDNPIGVVLSIFFGTSMFQFKNIVKKPIIWLPTIITSAILGPLVLLFDFTPNQGLNAAELGISSSWTMASGMGTSGLVGQIGTITALGKSYNNFGDWRIWVFIFVLQIALPIALVYVIDLIFRKFNLIVDGDLKV
ncbi:MAG: PTS sugar transporter subunit IIC [Acholeplasmataceae bacterium]|jgi:uncharacterized membrane protein